MVQNLDKNKKQENFMCEDFSNISNFC